MIFYDCSTAPSPRRARIFIAEKGLEIDTRDISIAKGEQMTEPFRAINPRATLPVLVTDADQALTENIAIATYLETRFPEPALMGETPDEKGAVLMWNAICEQQGGLAVAEAFRNSHPRMAGRALTGPRDFEQIPELAARGAQRVSDFFVLLEDRLHGRDWLALDQFSFADISAFVFVDFARVIKARIPEGNTATQAWFDRIAARPSASL